MGLLHWLTSPLAAAFGWGKDNKYKNQPSAFEQQLAPFLAQFADTSKVYSGQAGTDYGKAGSAYDEAMAYYHNLIHGDRTSLLNNFDASAVTKGLDEQQLQNYELAPRGGRRAATAANLGFDKFATLNSYLQQLRSGAPDKIANLGQALTNMAQGKLSAAMGGTSGASNILFEEQQIRQQEADRKAAFLGSIFEAVGNVAGFFACNTLDTWILTPKGWKTLGELRVGDKVCIPSDLSGELFEEAKIVRKELKENQDVYQIITNGSYIKGTLSHILNNMDEEEVSILNLQNSNVKLPFYMNGKFHAVKMIKFDKLPAATVGILKLENEKQNYRYITNGFVSVDADCLNGKNHA